MSSTCDVCGAQPSKYKCPNCTVKYCSLTCFKSHKPTHDAAESSSAAPTVSQTETITTTTASAPAPTPAPNQTAAAATADPLTTLLSSPALQRLLETNPTLRATLRSIYASTIEPDPEEWAEQQRRAQQRHSMSFRGRGRGGRGGRGGGRGGGPDMNGQRPRGPWKQEFADKRAVERIVRAQQESENLDAGGEGMREFVELVTAAVAAAGNEDGDQRMDEGGD
ncbi:Box C/D snoRNA protein 1 [Lasiodiplodia hormozganensis]|uniref:Box C/D snoRNA protein 1 n=1 Tax=Lasiodiplodia hormozganensis TaxID=869390 RepID=A0AA39YKM3_9PEZI|nr:Box C/D snoRNA protein 1 [Lasiodiplodia hormozganensis]